MGEIAYVNGQFGPLAQARVSVDDRGYLFGDGVYEAVRTYNGRLWLWDRHQQRLRASLEKIGVTTFDVDSLDAVAEEALRRAGNDESLVYYHVTRGTAPRVHAFDGPLTPNVVMTVRPISPRNEAQWRDGVACVTVPDQRWGRCDIKSLNLLPNVLAKRQAHERGCHEAILYNKAGLVTEAASTSVFCVIDDVLRTHPADCAILPGITRRVAMELADELGVPCREKPVAVDEIGEARELFLTGTGDEVTSVVRLNDRPIGDGRPGPIARKLHEAYLRLIHESLGWSTASDASVSP